MLDWPLSTAPLAGQQIPGGGRLVVLARGLFDCPMSRLYCCWRECTGTERFLRSPVGHTSESTGYFVSVTRLFTQMIFLVISRLLSSKHEQVCAAVVHRCVAVAGRSPQRVCTGISVGLDRRLAVFSAFQFS